MFSWTSLSFDRTGQALQKGTCHISNHLRLQLMPFQSTRAFNTCVTTHLSIDGIVRAAYFTSSRYFNQAHLSWYTVLTIIKQAHGRVIVDAVGYDRFGTSSTNRCLYVPSPLIGDIDSKWSCADKHYTAHTVAHHRIPKRPRHSLSSSMLTSSSQMTFFV